MMKKYLLTLLFTLVLQLAAAPLPQPLAFPIKGKYQNNSLYVTWSLPKGYYLYRDKMKFSLASTAGKIQAIHYPKATELVLADHTIERVFENSVTVIIPLMMFQPTLDLQIHTQGCTAQGFCYPPRLQTAHINELGKVTLHAKTTKQQTQTAQHHPLNVRGKKNQVVLFGFF